MRGVRETVAGLAAPRHLRSVMRLPGTLSTSEASLLYRLACEVSGGCIIKIGRFRGRSTLALALGGRAGANPSIYIVEPLDVSRTARTTAFGADDRCEFDRARLASHDYDAVRPTNLPSNVLAEGWSELVDLLVIDGEWTPGAIVDDALFWGQHLADDALVVVAGPSPRLLALDELGVEQMERRGELTVCRLLP